MDQVDNYVSGAVHPCRVIVCRCVWVCVDRYTDTPYLCYVRRHTPLPTHTHKPNHTPLPTQVHTAYHTLIYIYTHTYPDTYIHIHTPPTTQFDYVEQAKIKKAQEKARMAELEEELKELKTLKGEVRPSTQTDYACPRC
jgi:hypothetical protein